MTLREHLTDAAIAAKAQYATYGGAGVALYGGFTANDIAAFCGALAALGGFIAHLFFKWRADRREQEIKALEKQRLLLDIQRLQPPPP